MYGMQKKLLAGTLHALLRSQTDLLITCIQVHFPFTVYRVITAACLLFSHSHSHLASDIVKMLCNWVLQLMLLTW